jgi:phytoene dehydrogenase-like protein
LTARWRRQGKSVLEVIVRTQYAYWQRIYGRRIYDEEQRQVSQILREHLEGWHPGIGAEVEVVDEATPLSYERYTGNWKGSTCGWLLTRETLPMMINGLPKTLPGLSGFVPGRAVGRAGRGCGDGGGLRQECDPDDLRRR